MQIAGSEYNYKEIDYTMEDITDIAFHIYVPRGTHLKNTRVSTWMNPIVDNDDVLSYELTDKEKKKIKLGKWPVSMQLFATHTNLIVFPPQIFTVKARLKCQTIT